MKRKILFSLAFVLAAAAASALTVLQLNLEQLTGLSDKVFAGRCVSVEGEKDAAGRNVTKVTFDVTENLKNTPEKQVTFRQIGLVDGGDDIGMRDGMRIEGLDRDLPRYEVGEEAIVFLSAPGNSGLTAPVGLSQGKFSVVADGSARSVVNGAGNRGLMIGASQSPKLKALATTSAGKKLTANNGGEIPYSDFVSLIKSLASQ